MADNVIIPATGSGDATPSIATDDVSSVHYQKIKVDGGGDGVSVPIVAGQQAMAASLPVVIASNQTAVPISGTVTASGTVAATQSGAWTVQPGNTANTTAWKVDGSAVTQPVSAASLPLPTGAATSAKQPALGTAGTSSTDVISVQGIASGTALPISGTVTATVSGVSTAANQATEIASLASIDGKITAVNTGAVVVSSSALPTGASTAAKQPALGTAGTASADVITVQGIASMTALKVDGSAVTQPVSGTVTATVTGGTVTGTGTAGSAAAGVVTVQGIASMTKLLVTPDANAAINNAQWGGTNVITGGTAGGPAVGGIQAHDAADSGNNPVKVGAKATSSEPAVVATGDIANLITDLVGKLIVLPYANPENFVSGAITSAMTGTTSTSLIAAPASGLRNYITQITVSNAHATVGTDIIIQDGSGGTTLYTIPAAAAYGGATVTFPTPLRQPTTATALFCANVTTGASTKASASGYKGA